MQVAKHLGRRPRHGLIGETETSINVSLLASGSDTKTFRPVARDAADRGRQQAATRTTYIVNGAPPNCPHATFKRIVRDKWLDGTLDFHIPLAGLSPQSTSSDQSAFFYTQIEWPFSTCVCAPFWEIGDREVDEEKVVSG